MPLRTEASRAKKVRFRSNQIALLVAPPVLFTSVYLAYRGFALWHLAPLSVRPSTMPGGAGGFIAGALLLGLGWGWVAWRTGSIRWTVVSHILLDLSGLGALKYSG